MVSFDVNPWCEGNRLKKETADILKAQDLDTKEALTVVLWLMSTKCTWPFYSTQQGVLFDCENSCELGPDAMSSDLRGEVVILLLAEMCAWQDKSRFLLLVNVFSPVFIPWLVGKSFC